MRTLGRIFAAGVVVCTLTVAIVRPSIAANGDCAQPVSTGSGPTASDCLFILRAAVGADFLCNGFSCKVCVHYSLNIAVISPAESTLFWYTLIWSDSWFTALHVGFVVSELTL